MTREPMDDLDLLYTRLEPVALPPNFVANVMAQVAQPSPAPSRLRALWIALDVAAALVLAWAAFSVGRVLALGTFDQGTAGLLFDLDLALAAPAEWLMAVGEFLPIVAILSLVAAAVVVALATRAILAGSFGTVRTA